MANHLASLYDRPTRRGPGGEAPPSLSTARLRMRPLRRSDASLLRLHAGEAAVARMTSSIPHPYPPGAAEAFIERAATTAAGAAWAIDGAGMGLPELVGTLELRRPGGQGAEIGYWIAPPFWNEGLAQEAVGAVIEAEPFGRVPVFGSVFRDNPASARVLEAQGFERAGGGETYSVARGETVGTWVYRRAV